MSRTYKDRAKWNDEPNRVHMKRKYPRVPLIQQRSEPFEEKPRPTEVRDETLAQIKHLKDCDDGDL